MDTNEDGQSWPIVDRRKTHEAVFELLDEIKDGIAAIEKRLDSIEHRIDAMGSAFVVNDLGKPDYDGHRRAHIKLIDDVARMEGLKHEGAKKLVAAIMGALATVFFMGAVAWIKSLS